MGLYEPLFCIGCYSCIVFCFTVNQRVAEFKTRGLVRKVIALTTVIFVLFHKKK
ncbi:hypothetical protein BY458DRAFT_529084 [Sporodiniella umbellata]|nr:hypothetical protein BY458DRAFT_529084 [Sporodiniella umbellata]